MERYTRNDFHYLKDRDKHSDNPDPRSSFRSERCIESRPVAGMFLTQNFGDFRTSGINLTVGETKTNIGKSESCQSTDFDHDYLSHDVSKVSDSRFWSHNVVNSKIKTSRLLPNECRGDISKKEIHYGIGDRIQTTACTDKTFTSETWKTHGIMNSSEEDDTGTSALSLPNPSLIQSGLQKTLVLASFRPVSPSSDTDGEDDMGIFSQCDYDHTIQSKSGSVNNNLLEEGGDAVEISGKISYITCPPKAKHHTGIEAKSDTPCRKLTFNDIENINECSSNRLGVSNNSMTVSKPEIKLQKDKDKVGEQSTSDHVVTDRCPKDQTSSDEVNLNGANNSNNSASTKTSDREIKQKKKPRRARKDSNNKHCTSRKKKKKGRKSNEINSETDTLERSSSKKKKSGIKSKAPSSETDTADEADWIESDDESEKKVKSKSKATKTKSKRKRPTMKVKITCNKLKKKSPKAVCTSPRDTVSPTSDNNPCSKPGDLESVNSTANKTTSRAVNSAHASKRSAMKLESIRQKHEKHLEALANEIFTTALVKWDQYLCRSQEQLQEDEATIARENNYTSEATDLVTNNELYIWQLLDEMTPNVPADPISKSNKI